MEILRRTSSGSQSVVVVPSSTLPRRVTAPAENSMASTRDVLPTPPCPTTPTLRILSISIAIHGPPGGSAAVGRIVHKGPGRLKAPPRCRLHRHDDHRRG